MPEPRRGHARSCAALASGLAAMVLMSAAGAWARGVTDGSDAAIGPDRAGAVLVLIERHLRGGDARVSGLRPGRAGAVCGSVDVRNRMGSYTGPRGFVAVPDEGFIGRLPEGPELRNPISMADFRAMERAKALFAENCAGG